jgi:hypothetical protein
MDLASGLLDTLTLMELRALVSHIHHVRVWHGLQILHVI